jgi:hypothetical protein
MRRDSHGDATLTQKYEHKKEIKHIKRQRHPIYVDE